MAKQKPIGFRFDYWLWDRLQEKGMTQEQLAQQAGMSPSAITLYLARRRSPTLATMKKILNALDADLQIIKNEKATQTKEVVFCKDCLYKSRDDGVGKIVCGLSIMGSSHDRLWFCADGKLK